MHPAIFCERCSGPVTQTGTFRKSQWHHKVPVKSQWTTGTFSRRHRTSLREALEIRIANFKRCVAAVAPFVVWIAFKFYGPPPASVRTLKPQFVNSSRGPLKKCTNRRAFKLATHQLFLTFPRGVRVGLFKFLLVEAWAPGRPGHRLPGSYHRHYNVVYNHDFEQFVQFWAICTIEKNQITLTRTARSIWAMCTIKKAILYTT